MAERDVVEAAFRRLDAYEWIEAFLGEDLVERAQPVGPLGVARRRQMVEAGGVA